MSMVVNIEELKNVAAHLKDYGDTAVVDVASGDNMISKSANELEEYIKKLEVHDSTKEMAEKLKPVPTRLKHNTIIMRDIAETLAQIAEIIERHENQAISLIYGATSQEP